MESRYGTHSQIQNFDLIEVELRGHGRGGLVSEEPEFGMNEESCIWPPLILKLRGVIFFFFKKQVCRLKMWRGPFAHSWNFGCRTSRLWDHRLVSASHCVCLLTVK